MSPVALREDIAQVPLCQRSDNGNATVARASRGRVTRGPVPYGSAKNTVSAGAKRSEVVALT